MSAFRPKANIQKSKILTHKIMFVFSMHFSQLKLVCLFLLVLLTFLMMGCTTTNIPNNYTLPEDASVGIATGSITYLSKCEQSGVYKVVVSNIETNNNYIITSGPWYRPVDDEIGVGWPFAIELPAGKYTITGWEIQHGYAFLYSSSAISIPFSIEAGTVAYLGNFNFYETGHTLCAAKAAIVSLEDKSRRDISIIKKRHPALNGIPLNYVIALNKKIDSIGGKGKFQAPPLLLPLNF
ncbi:MAG: hypothetical protein OEY87_06810 [Gammaproteobacteria bacterium]|nr:hypothetical protein [Gammaproteobacteria bacterium]MDH5735818.1 hypothetical protein [Gammaproteobacteria bacterium]